MPGGRPPKKRHAGGRPPVYLSEEERRAARRKSKAEWYHRPENHERVKCQMRERYREQKEMDDTDTTEGCVIEVDHARRAPNEIHPLQPLARAQDLLKQFSDYIGPSNDKFVAHAMDLVRCDYRPGESSPILDQIEEQIADWQTNIQGIQNEILNGAGAWSAEYLEVEGILEAVNAVTRRISDMHIAHLEGTLL
ncbi:hypothetical protein BDZ89DRAFT_1129849 [Hymenopellis radicata]|nr:hypothetical protein BDZ89DRAFT_1129849 [Hymenopellis radicata]